MEFRILGPLEVADGDTVLPLTGAKQRALLAILLLNANQVVSSDRLIDGLWGEEPPDSGTPALPDLAYESFAQAAIGRLEELRVAALEPRIDADLALGRHALLAGELEELVAEHPMRERLRGQLMLALYRSGR